MGFPVVQAAVEYDAEGYGAMLGWIQIVRMPDLDTDERTTLVDRAPQLAELELPYMAFGIQPVLFDAPSLTGVRNLTWDAHAVLVMSPDCLMTRTVLPLCGFSWGYRLRESRPIPTPAQRLEASTWNADADVLHTRHPSWTFGNEESCTQDATP